MTEDQLTEIIDAAGVSDRNRMDILAFEAVLDELTRVINDEEEDVDEEEEQEQDEGGEGEEEGKDEDQGNRVKAKDVFMSSSRFMQENNTEILCVSSRF